MPIAQPQTNLILSRSIVTADTIAEEFRQRLAEELADRFSYGASTAEMLEAARAILFQFEPILAEHLSDSELAGWIAGYYFTSKKFPDWLADQFSNKFPPQPPRMILTDWFGDDPEIEFPKITEAAKSLLSRGILTREDFDAAAEDVRRRTFTIAGDFTERAIEDVRDILSETIREGASLDVFESKLSDGLDRSFIGRGHIETVYRTNVQAAFRDGRETLADNPIVTATFPYQEYLPIGDARTRPEHWALGKLGLDGTGIYRRDDPFWNRFTPPIDFNCRCSTNLLTIRQAARKGVKEAQRWLDTGIAPIRPEFRGPLIPFNPPAGFGHRRVAA